VERSRPDVSAPAFWDELYAEGRDGWELGSAAPALRAWIEAGGHFSAMPVGEPARICVPGCGRGHDARLLARSGYRVWGFDFAATAIARARALAADEGVDVAFERRDLFTLATEFPNFFDGIWEYTCFCAIDPARRGEYAELLRAIVRRGGTLLACFFPLRDGGDGPPFPVSRAEIEHLLVPHFRIVAAGPPARSAAQRQGLEWLVVAERT